MGTHAALIAAASRFPVQTAPIRSKYDVELRRLIGDMLYKDPAKRPTIRSIMARPYVQHHLRQLIAQHSRPKVLAPSAESAPATVPVRSAAAAVSEQVAPPPVKAAVIEEEKRHAEQELASAQERLSSTVAELNAAKTKLMHEQLAKPLRSSKLMGGRDTPTDRVCT